MNRCVLRNQEASTHIDALAAKSQRRREVGGSDTSHPATGNRRLDARQFGQSGLHVITPTSDFKGFYFAILYIGITCVVIFEPNTRQQQCSRLISRGTPCAPTFRNMPSFFFIGAKSPPRYHLPQQPMCRCKVLTQVVEKRDSAEPGHRRMERGAS